MRTETVSYFAKQDEIFSFLKSNLIESLMKLAIHYQKRFTILLHARWIIGQINKVFCNMA